MLFGHGWEPLEGLRPSKAPREVPKVGQGGGVESPNIGRDSRRGGETPPRPPYIKTKFVLPHFAPNPPQDSRPPLPPSFKNRNFVPILARPRDLPFAIPMRPKERAGLRHSSDPLAHCLNSLRGSNTKVVNSVDTRLRCVHLTALEGTFEGATSPRPPPAPWKIRN